MANTDAQPTVEAGAPDWISDFLARLAELLRHTRTCPTSRTASDPLSLRERVRVRASKIRISAAWLFGLQILALWPVWRWYAARIGDGSDEPLGPLALVLALTLLYGKRREFLGTPRALPLLAAGLLTLIQSLAMDWPPLVQALLGTAALGLSLAASLRRPRDAAPLWALLALSLPLVASLQFYAGYPLRLLAAEGAGWVLRLCGLPVLAEGAGLRWDERLMLVDAPCSGVHMLWVGLVMAAAASALANASPARLLLNASLAVGLVLLGNVLRNAALFIKETGLIALPAWTHEGIGVALFALVLVPVALVSLRAGPSQAAPESRRPGLTSPCWPAPVAALVFLLAAGLGGLDARPATPAAHDPDPAWPTHFRGRELIRLPLAPAETRWLRDFPGAAARFTDGERELLIRRVERPTRRLHPAADCFRGTGYTVSPPEIREADGERWSCFTARKEGLAREVCERLHDEQGGAWTDASSWYWSAVLGRGRGPWWAVTVAGGAE